MESFVWAKTQLETYVLAKHQIPAGIPQKHGKWELLGKG
jgi:hypothetical protein